jgi:hypothetical protein
MKSKRDSQLIIVILIMHIKICGEQRVNQAEHRLTQTLIAPAFKVHAVSSTDLTAWSKIYEYTLVSD